MNTDPQDTSPSEADTPVEQPEDDGDALMQLLVELDTVDEDAEEASLNKCSISDNNGGRIELMKRPMHTFPAFLFLKRLLCIPRKLAKPEQGDGA